MARVTMRINSRDLQRVQRDLDRIPEAVRQGAADAVEESAGSVRAQVSRTVRVWRGRLRDRVMVRRHTALSADVGWFDNDTYYAQFQEFGTSSIEADPVLTRAALEEEREFPRRVRDMIRRRL